jgi:acetylornithine deacetylase/succinyl-diaminopimelate desuccinylase-like protein
MNESPGGLEREVVQNVLDQIDVDLLVRLERGAVRIPSLSFEEQECARYFASEMKRLGLEVEIMEVQDPYGSGRRGLQPIGWLRGTGGGPSMMLNGHMDHMPVAGEWERDPFSGEFEDGYIYGRGAQDDKGGIVAAIGAAVAIKRASLSLRGDVIICPVMGHKFGGVGTHALIQRGLRPTYCINTENSGIGIARVAVGVIKFLLHAYATPTFFTISAAVRAKFMNPLEQLAVLMQQMGPSLEPIRSGGWLTFEPNQELPDYPQLNYDEITPGYIHRGGQAGPSLRTSNQATMEMQIRTVPGQSPETVRGDLERLLTKLHRDLPNLKVEVEIPPKSAPYAGWVEPPFATPPDAPLVKILARWHTFVAEKPPVIGAEPRLGAVGDGNILAGYGTQVVQYGPGNVMEFSVWNERIRVDEIVIAAKAMALATAELCR